MTQKHSHSTDWQSSIDFSLGHARGLSGCISWWRQPVGVGQINTARVTVAGLTRNTQQITRQCNRWCRIYWERPMVRSIKSQFAWTCVCTWGGFHTSLFQADRHKLLRCCCWMIHLRTFCCHIQQLVLFLLSQFQQFHTSTLGSVTRLTYISAQNNDPSRKRCHESILQVLSCCWQHDYHTSKAAQTFLHSGNELVNE